MHLYYKSIILFSLVQNYLDLVLHTFNSFFLFFRSFNIRHRRVCEFRRINELINWKLKIENWFDWLDATLIEIWIEIWLRNDKNDWNAVENVLKEEKTRKKKNWGRSLRKKREKGQEKEKRKGKGWGRGGSGLRRLCEEDWENWLNMWAPKKMNVEKVTTLTESRNSQ